ncbi:hypothetical protein ACLGIH_33385 [Streptomyces sp. HMX87]|uniref:hypothetical protein n=1 Tax=Streptomyces sp. HMX87 TaxID=3390849 RepID=UPI003A86D349
MSGGEMSGVDLARQALVAAREAARKNGSTARKGKPRQCTGRPYGGTAESRSAWAPRSS